MFIKLCRVYYGGCEASGGIKLNEQTDSTAKSAITGHSALMFKSHSLKVLRENHGKEVIQGMGKINCKNRLLPEK